MDALENKALADTKTDRQLYWESKSVRRMISRNLKQFVKHSQLITHAHHPCHQDTVDAKSERWWNDLIFAHHHGLKTLLLDWTTNPLVALYFAVENAASKPEEGVSGAVYAIKVRGKPSKQDVHEKRWHNFDEVVKKYPVSEFCPFWIMVNPPLNSDRIVRQSGKFSYHPSVSDRHLVDKDGMTPEQGLYHDELLGKVEIGRDGDDPTDDIRKMLGIMNVHRASLFPDHDGIALYLNNEWEEIADDDPGVLPLALASNIECDALTELRSLELFPSESQDERPEVKVQK